MVVHYVREMICGQFIGTLPQHLVVQGAGVDLDMPADHVVHLHHLVFRHLETHSPVGGLRQKPFNLGGGQSQRIAQMSPRLVVIDKGLAVGLCLCACGGKGFGGIESIISIAARHQLLGILAVDAPPLALAVRRMRMPLGRSLHHLAVGIHALVRHYAAPAESLDNIGLRPGHETMRVGILDTEDEISTVLLGIQVVIQCRPHTAHVQGTGGGGRESYACLSHCSFFLGLRRMAGSFSRELISCPSLVTSTGGLSRS